MASSSPFADPRGIERGAAGPSRESMRPGGARFESGNGHTLPSELPVGMLLQRIARDGALLVRQEVELAKHELRDQVSVVTRSVAAMAGAAVFGVIAVLMTAWGIALGLATFMPSWLACILVGVGLAIAAVAIVAPAKKKLAALPKKPEQTMQSVREDVRTVREATQ